MIVIAESNASSRALVEQDVKQRQLHVRSLAASCAACHGTNGNSIGDAADLAGIDSAYFLKKMQGFKSGEVAATVMNRHAKGLNMQEITDLSEYFSTRVPKASVFLPSQALSTSHSN